MTRKSMAEDETLPARSVAVIEYRWSPTPLERPPVSVPAHGTSMPDPPSVAEQDGVGTAPSTCLLPSTMLEESCGPTESMLIPETVTLVSLPAASTAVPIADWFAPFAEMTTSAGHVATPDRSSSQEN